MLSKAALAGFAPRPVQALGPRTVWAASRSLCPGAVLVVAGAGNQLQTCSPSGRWRMGPEKALCVLAPSPHPSPATEGPTSGPSQKLQKSDFWELPSRKGNSPREPKLSASACLLRKAALAGLSLSPVLAIGRRSVWSSCCSVFSGGLQVIVIAGNQLQTCSTSGRRRMGPEKALCALAPTPHIPQAREGTT